LRALAIVVVAIALFTVLTATVASATTTTSKTLPAFVKPKPFAEHIVENDKHMYKTKPGGHEWVIDMDDPQHDLENTRHTDWWYNETAHSWRVHQDEMRLEKWSAPYNKHFDNKDDKNEYANATTGKWLNVEVTAYFRVIKTAAVRDGINTTMPAKGKVPEEDDNFTAAPEDPLHGDNNKPLFQIYIRGAHHKTSEPCEGSTYKARIYANGSAAWIKEVTHPMFTPERGAHNVYKDVPIRLGEWVGFKAVLYNINNNTAVRMESYLDRHANGTWTSLVNTTDAGGWKTIRGARGEPPPSECGLPSDAILTGPGGFDGRNLIAFRTDDTLWDFRYLSAREIEPPK
jgi:hypothetical protein